MEQNRQTSAIHLTTLLSSMMIAAQVGAKATRDSLFLSTFAASELPRVMVGASILSIIAALLMSRLISQFGPSRLLPIIYSANSLLFLTEWQLIDVTRGVTAIIVYLHASSFGVLVVSGFWAVINERFDPHTAKSAVSRIGAGAALGGIAGGIAAQQVVSRYNLESMLLILCAINLLSALTAMRVGSKKSAKGNTSTEQWWIGITSIGKVGYLRHMASLVLVAAATEALIEFSFKSAAAGWTRSDASLMSFFAIFYTAIAVLTFLAQSLLSGRALQSLGLAGTIAALPASVVLIGVLATALPQLWTIVILCGAESVLSNTMFRSGYELLYTPLSAERKRPVKIMIDVAFERMGSAFGAGLVFLLLLFIESPEQILIGIGVLLAVFALWNSYRLHHGYVQALADSLRSGTIALSDSDIIDATTRRTLSDTTHALNREQLLTEIQAYRISQQDNVTFEEKPPEQKLVPKIEKVLENDSLRPLMEELLSNDTMRIQKTLDFEPIDPRLAVLVIPTLAHPRLVRNALIWLRKAAPKIVGQLTDALVAPELSSTVRRRIPWVLKVVNEQRAIDGLLTGLSDELFEIRHACALGLTEVKQNYQSIEFTKREIFTAVSRELQLDEEEWNRRKLVDQEPQDSNVVSEYQRYCADKEKQNLEHIFTLLGLVLDRETLRNSLRALQSGDDYLRGTSLEYLENVLPERLRKELWPHLVSEKLVDTNSSKE